MKPGRRLGTWVDPSDRRPSPHHPERFGDLVFVPFAPVTGERASASESIMSRLL
jgi:hypothetical protein